jgi:hypothetical protein
MKNSAVFLFTFLFLVAFTAQNLQEKFYSIQRSSENYSEWTSDAYYNLTVADLFQDDDRLQKQIMLDADALNNTGTYDFAKLDSLETLTIPAGILCDEPDSVRKAFVNKTVSALQHISCFAKCPNLKRVVFVIGVGTFTNEEQSKPVGKEEWYDERYHKRQAQLELELAWKAFGENVQQQLPGVKLYAAVEVW